MAKWFVTAKSADFDSIAKEHGISPILARIIRNRDIIEQEEIDIFLNGTMQNLHHPELLKDMKKAVEILDDKIAMQKKIRIIGDYDIDGVCSAYVLYYGLKHFDADVDIAIPHRVKDGYGLNESLIKDAFDAGIDTIITCDNGISAKEQIAYAKTLGMTVIITDHHEVPFVESADGKKEFDIPLADAVIDPKQETCEYPFKGICGAVVALKFIQAFSLKKEGNYRWTEQSELTEFAAFATVGDVMELIDENRILVKYGLKQIEHTKNLGMQALLEVTGILNQKLTPYHIGFVLGPCLNATGRLDTAERAITLFQSKTKQEAIAIALELKQLNDSRKKMTQDALEEAITMISESDLNEDRVLVVLLNHCHESLAGIIAGRLREKYYKPVFVLTTTEDGVKGSGRSIDSYSMYENMTKVKDLFTKYGGHKLAAGLSMKEESVLEFRKRLNEMCTLKEEDFVEKVLIDVPMPISYADQSMCEELEKLAPFGMGNPKPLFARKNLMISNLKVLGRDRKICKFQIEEEKGIRRTGVFFGDEKQLLDGIENAYGKVVLEELMKNSNREIAINLAYYPDINEYNGTKTVQLIVKHFSFE